MMPSVLMEAARATAERKGVRTTIQRTGLKESYKCSVELLKVMGKNGSQIQITGSALEAQ